MYGELCFALLTAIVGRRPLLALCVCDLLFRRILSRLRRNQTSAVKPTINASVRLSGSSQHRHQHQHHLFLSFPSVVCAGDDAVWLSLRLASLPLPSRSFPLLALSFLLECHSFDPNPCPKRQQNRQTDGQTDRHRHRQIIHRSTPLPCPSRAALAAATINSLPYPTQTHPLILATTTYHHLLHCTALLCLLACLPACLLARDSAWLLAAVGCPHSQPTLRLQSQPVARFCPPQLPPRNSSILLPLVGPLHVFLLACPLSCRPRVSAPWSTRPAHNAQRRRRVCC